MYHVSQVDTAFDGFFGRLKLISRLGSQLWLVNLKIKNPRTGKYFIEQTVKPAVTGLLKTFLCRYVYPICKWKSPLLSLFFYCQEEIEFSKITVVCSPLYCSICKLKPFYFYRRFAESVGKSFLWCSVLKTDRLKMFMTWYKKTGWSSFFPVHTFRRWMSRRGRGGERGGKGGVSGFRPVRFCGLFTDPYAYMKPYHPFQWTADKWAYGFFFFTY